jgi:hypothetical protein
MTKEFDFATDFKTAEEKQQEWWLSLTPAQRWKANWELVEFLLSSNPDIFNRQSEEEKNKYVLE